MYLFYINKSIFSLIEYIKNYIFDSSITSCTTTEYERLLTVCMMSQIGFSQSLKNDYIF